MHLPSSFLTAGPTQSARTPFSTSVRLQLAAIVKQSLLTTIESNMETTQKAKTRLSLSDEESNKQTHQKTKNYPNGDRPRFSITCKQAYPGCATSKPTLSQQQPFLVCNS